MDALQEFNDAHVADALSAHARRPQAAGRSHCANLDCEQPIAPARQALGAQLCLVCQRAEEAQAAHFKQWQGR